MPVVKSSERTHQFVPEPFAFDVDPALALAVSIPAAMPTVAVVAVPNVAIIFLAELEFAGLEIDVLVALQIQGNKNVNFKSGKFKVGQKYNGHIWYGHNRHRWHGRWYAYGEGECWINIEGEWFWNELVCPF